MKNSILLVGMITFFSFACHQPRTSAKEEAVVDTPAYAPAVDTTPAIVEDSTVTVIADTIVIDSAKLIGKWLQPVTGKDNEWQGMELKKNRKAIAINMYSLVYEKWKLQHDTLLLWNHAEGVKSSDSTRTIDTAIIRDLTDTSLVLFPVKAAEGYLEKYRKEKGGKKVKSRK
ncbi:lipocalin family protein [Chitinophaga sp.]|uniref:lipocalin family protein n=1 Tax=Chitinophaga sp. TaxID=1869181 RepID=UPI0031E31AF4